MIVDEEEVAEKVTDEEESLRKRGIWLGFEDNTRPPRLNRGVRAIGSGNIT